MKENQKLRERKSGERWDRRECGLEGGGRSHACHGQAATPPPRPTVRLYVKTAIHHLKWIHYLTAENRHTHTHKQGRLVSSGGVLFDSNISLRDKSERELDFLLLGVRTAGHIYLHTEPLCVCVFVCVCIQERETWLVLWWQADLSSV